MYGGKRRQLLFKAVFSVRKKATSLRLKYILGILTAYFVSHDTLMVHLSWRSGLM